MALGQVGEVWGVVRVYAGKKCKGPGCFRAHIPCKHEHELKQGLLSQKLRAGREISQSVNLNF